MGQGAPAVRIVSLMTLVAGLSNVWSVVGPPPPHHLANWPRFLPLELFHHTRSAILLTGLAFVIASFHLYRRKRRAVSLVAVLSVFSALIHLLKGPSFLLAGLSAGLLIFLWRTRGHFKVLSSIPNGRWLAVSFAGTFLVVLAYGVAGFWFLDPREFGINFTLGDSIRRTLLFLSLVGDPEIVPHTRHARWFVDSLYLSTGMTFSYALFAAFRPVVYHVHTLPHERHLARELLHLHGQCALDYFKVWPDKTFHFSPAETAFLSYRVAGHFALVLGDPVGPSDEIEPLIVEFIRYCETNDWRLAFHQVLPDHLEIYQRLGFRKLKIGDDAIVDLTRFNLGGKHFKRIRARLSALQREGIVFERHAPPLAPSLIHEAQVVSDAWLTIPGRRERSFTVGRFDPDYLRTTTLCAARDRQGHMLAFTNEIPSFRESEATIDLMRHRPDAEAGIMDFLFVRLFLALRATGYGRFNMGMAPLAGFQEAEEASAEERAVHYFFKQFHFLFSYQGLRRYKAKYASSWEPRYLVYRNVLQLPLLGRAILRVSERKTNDGEFQ
ncbi:MAG: phosphatidylglycerol lysyltransferase domain-containing protein [Acidobacteriota bacterium]